MTVVKRAHEFGQHLTEVRPQDAMRALAVEMVILTGLRVRALLSMRREDIDRDARTLTIHAEHMKGKREQHRVPLSVAALDVLDRVKGLEAGDAGREDPTGLVFVSRAADGSGENTPVSWLSLAQFVQQRMGLETLFGFRGGLIGWAEENRVDPRVVQQIFGHEVGADDGRLYSRLDGLEERRTALEAWGEYVSA